jgi:hypothetical protein
MSEPTSIFSLLEDPAYRETDPSRILEWSKVEDYAEVVAYFQQRFGPGFHPPAFHIDAEMFESLLVGDTPLFAKMSFYAPEAFDTFKSAFVRNSSSVLVLFPVDSTDPARPVIDFVREHMDHGNQAHRDLLEGLDGISRKCGEHYLDWVNRGRPIYRINIPSRPGQAERRYVA